MTTNNPTPQPAGEGGAPEPCAVCSFHWNQIVMPREAHNRNCPHYDERDSGCRCQRCGTRYKVDVMITDALWKEIHGNDTLLCGNCIISAIERLDQFDWYQLTQGDTRATQPATAPSELPMFRTTKEAMEYAAQHKIPTIIPVATPTDVAERARRAALKISDWLRTGDGEVDGNAINEVAAIITSEFSTLPSLQDYDTSRLA